METLDPVPRDQYLGYTWKDGKLEVWPNDPGIKNGWEPRRAVEHPQHYVEGRKYEPWDVIEDWKLNYFAATTLKYISRYERKGEPVKDLKKAIEFLKREIARLEKEKS